MLGYAFSLEPRAGETYKIKSTGSSDLLPQAPKIERLFHDNRDSHLAVLLLPVEDSELLDEVQLCPCSSLHGVELLHACTEAERLPKVFDRSVPNFVKDRDPRPSCHILGMG